MTRSCFKQLDSTGCYQQLRQCSGQSSIHSADMALFKLYPQRWRLCPGSIHSADMALFKALSRRVNGTVAWIRQGAETISAQGTVYAMERSDTCKLIHAAKAEPSPA